MVEVQKLEVFCDFSSSRATLRGSAWSRCKNSRFFCDFCGARVTLCGDRRGRGAKTRGFLRFLKFPRHPAGISVVEVQKLEVFCDFARPSAGIGVVEVQKLEVFSDFCGARATLCADRIGVVRCKNSRFFAISQVPARPSAGIGSAWSRCKNSRFFAISQVPARPSAGIGVVEVQKL